MSIGGAFVGAAVAGIGLAWNLRGWIGDQFTATRKSFYDAIASHEKIDQSRHEQNLDRFSDIRVALARHGIDGGDDDARSH